MTYLCKMSEIAYILHHLNNKSLLEATNRIALGRELKMYSVNIQKDQFSEC